MRQANFMFEFIEHTIRISELDINAHNDQRCMRIEPILLSLAEGMK